METIFAKIASIIVAPFILIGGLFSPNVPVAQTPEPTPIVVGGGSGTINQLPQLITTKDEGTDLTTRTASLDFVGAGVSASNVGNAVTVTISGGGGGGGTDVALDLGDNGSNESSAISEIAVTGDTNSIFTEPSADKLLIAVANDWPKADVSDLVTFADAGGDTTTFVALGTSATGNLAPATDAGLTFNATTNALTATTFIGALTGNASTATALAANGTNCSAGDAPRGVDASGNAENCTTYLTGNQSITLSGDISGSGTTAITTTIGNDKILEVMLKAVDTASDEECLTYESTAGDFEWQTCGSAGITGSDTHVLFFDGANNPAGEAGLVYDKTTDTLTIAGVVSTPTVTLSGTGTLNGLDTIDATGESTLEAALDLVGDVSSTGLSTTVIGNDKILEVMLKAVDAASDEECLTYESTVGDFEWQTCGGGGGGSVAGSDTQIQFNDGGAFGADAGLTYNKTTDFVTLAGGLVAPTHIGGTGTTSTLILQPTSGIGTTGADIIFNVGNNGATEAMRIFNSGRVGFNDGSTEPTSQVAILNNSLTTTQALTSGLVIENTTAATSGNQKISPALRLSGKGWKTTSTAASQDVSFLMDVLPVQGSTNPTGTLQFHTSINGGTITKLATIGSDGQFETFVASSGLASFKVDSTGTLFLSRTNSAAGKIFPSNDGAGTYASGGSGIFLGMQTGFGGSNGAAVTTGLTGNYVHTTGVSRAHVIRGGFAPTSGTGTMEGLTFLGTINQTGGANGSFKGFNFTPTLTAYADVRGFSMSATSTISSATSPLLKGIDIQNTINHTGSVTSSNYTDIFINDTETSLTGTTHNFADWQIGGTSKFKVRNSGLIVLESTITAGGTTGNQTINKPTGTVNIAAAGTAVTITNSLVTASSIVYAIARTNDATCEVKNAVPGSGTVTINMSAACTAETSVGFLVVNE